MQTPAATFAMGCFWSPEALFGSTRGVIRTRVGYAGGQLPDPTYKRLGDHTESVQLDYDPELISFKQLLQLFWSGHNPAKPVWGRQYMSAIFHQDPAQQQQARESLEQQSMGGMFRFPTELWSLERFYAAEPYHQKHYLRRHTDLMKELAGRFADEAALISSTVAARLNGALAGFGEVADLAPELSGLGISEREARRLVAIVQEHRRRGGL